VSAAKRWQSGRRRTNRRARAIRAIRPTTRTESLMLTQADRAAERRRVKLEEIQRQVKDGSLTIRKMTPDERRRYPAMPVKARRR